jgi:hypothetical protein
LCPYAAASLAIWPSGWLIFADRNNRLSKIIVQDKEADELNTLY